MGKRKQRDPGGYAADGGTDGYPPPPLLENEHFETYYRGLGLVPPSEWDAFLAALRTPLGVSFRITGRPDDPTALALRDWMERKHVQRMQQLVVPGAGAVPPPTPIPWLPGRLAWRFDVSRATLRGKGVRRADADGPAQDPTPEEAASKSTLAAFHEFLTQEVELGNMSRQEEVSMVPPEVLEVRPGQRVLDMCAAPGSKTQQLLECSAGSLEATCGGMVIANDAEYRRCHLLVHQAKRLNSPLLVVTNHDAQMLPTRLDVDGSGRLRFDRILCDVPCSGDGTLRKCPDLWRRWNEKLAWGVHRLQLAILSRGLSLLQPGGRLVYSTCSMNPIEDEAVVARALLKANAEESLAGGVTLVRTDELLPGLKRHAGVGSWRVFANGRFFESVEALRAEVGDKACDSFFPPPPDVASELHLERTMRVLPHQQDTGGFFIAVFEKAPVGSGGGEGGGAADAPDAAMAAEEAAGAAETQAAARGKEGAGVRAAHGEEGSAALAVGEGGEEGGVPCGGADEAGCVIDEVAEREKGQQHGLCYAFQNGSCLRGAACRFGHVLGGADAGAGSRSLPKGAKLAPHVRAVLHCSPRNNGKYDAIFSLADSFLGQVREFFGLGGAFPFDQLIARSATGKSVIFLAPALLALLRSDVQTKLKLVNTGVRLLEKCDDPLMPFGFRLTCEGVPCLLPYMTKQLLFLSTPELRALLTRRSLAPDVGNPSLVAALETAAAGSVAIVHDPQGRRAFDPTAFPLQLSLAATRTDRSPPTLTLHLKKSECDSMLHRLAPAR